MKPLIAIRDPAAYQLFADETRRKIIIRLQLKEMTVTQIAAALNMSPQAIYHHIRRLLKGQLIEVVKEERVGHFIESHYRATAEAFTIEIGRIPQSTRLFKEQATTILNALKRLGYTLEFTKRDVTQLIKLWEEQKIWVAIGEFEDPGTLDDLDFLTRQIVGELSEYLTTPPEDLIKQEEVNRQFRALLCSLLKS